MPGEEPYLPVDSSGRFWGHSALGTRQCGAMGIPYRTHAAGRTWIYIVLSAVGGSICSCRMRTGDTASAPLFPLPHRTACEPVLRAGIHTGVGMVSAIFLRRAWVSQRSGADSGCTAALYPAHRLLPAVLSGSYSVLFFLFVRDLFPMCNN